MVAVECNSVSKSFARERDGAERNGQSFFSRIFRNGRSAENRVKAVDSVSLHIERGEIFGLLGPNGSGKSTLVRMLSTLLFPDEGEILIFGVDVVREPLRARSRINRVSVDAAFFKKLSPWENLAYTSRLYGVPRDEARREALRILEEMGFDRKQFAQPMEDLSRGNQQKVAIARALITRPELLLLDEPTTGLDPVSKRQVNHYVRKIRKEWGVTVLLTTHDMDEAERACDRIAIIHQGRIVALDTPAGLKREFGGNGATTLEEVFFIATGSVWSPEGVEQAVG